MKKNKLLAILLAAMLAFGVVGCGGEDETDSGSVNNVTTNVDVQDEQDNGDEEEEFTFVGEWDCIGYEEDGQSKTEDDYGESYLTVNDDYTCDVTIMDEGYYGEWDFTESGIVLYIENSGFEEEVYCDMVDDVMYMDYMEMYTLLEKVQ